MAKQEECDLQHLLKMVSCSRVAQLQAAPTKPVISLLTEPWNELRESLKASKQPVANTLTFPPNFLWGTASSSHQNEGGNSNNQWSNFEQQPGAIHNGDQSGLAADWWNNAEGDFDLMQQFGLNAHRLSIEWSRVEPEPGVFDHQALDRYREMVGGLRARGIRPIVALNHFTLPFWFYLRGGWTNPESVVLFQRYTRKVVAALGDLCDMWITFNEPVVYVGQTWFRGIWPPRQPNPVRAIQSFRNLLFAHAAAYQEIHSSQPESQVGYAKAVKLYGRMREEHLLDRYAAGIKRWLFEHCWVIATADGKIRPPFGINDYHHPLADSFDFMGINYYTSSLVRFSPDPRKLFGSEHFAPDTELSDATSSGIPYSQYTPEKLHQICTEVAFLGKPIYIMENGLPDQSDERRGRWLVGHLKELHRAIQDGYDVRGYFHWTFVDNFEWNEGWGLRFGLVELDRETQVRTPRPSAKLYGEIARQNAITQKML